MAERDWRKDWEMCERARLGPWFVYQTTAPENASLVFEYPLTIQCTAAWVCAMVDNRDRTTAEFIAESRDALPYWLQRVKELEERLKALEGRRCETCKWWNEDESEWGFCGGILLESPDGFGDGMVELPGGFAEGDVPLRTRFDFGCVRWEARE